MITLADLDFSGMTAPLRRRLPVFNVGAEEIVVATAGADLGGQDASTTAVATQTVGTSLHPSTQAQGAAETKPKARAAKSKAAPANPKSKATPAIPRTTATPAKPKSQK